MNLVNRINSIKRSVNFIFLLVGALEFLTIGQRIKETRKVAGYSQASLAEKMSEMSPEQEKKVTRSLIAQIEVGNSNPTLEFLRVFVSICNTSYSYIIEGKPEYDKLSLQELFSMQLGRIVPYNTASGKAYKFLQIIEPLKRDKSFGQADITLVSVNEQAKYILDYHDPGFIESLPSFTLPGFKNGVYRAFEVEDDSMLQFEGVGLYPTDIIICSYVKDVSKIINNRVYVVVTNNKGIIIKRCINKLSSNSFLICSSDNQSSNFPPVTLEADKIKEVWEFEAKISHHLSKKINLMEGLAELKAKSILFSQNISELEKLMSKDL